MLTQAPGGRDNAKMVPKAYFSDLMLARLDGSYYMRRDRILAVFIMHSDIKFKSMERGIQCDDEKVRDGENAQVIRTHNLQAQVQSNSLQQVVLTYSPVQSIYDHAEQQQHEQDIEFDPINNKEELRKREGRSASLSLAGISGTIKKNTQRFSKRFSANNPGLAPRRSARTSREVVHVSPLRTNIEMRHLSDVSDIERELGVEI